MPQQRWSQSLIDHISARVHNGSDLSEKERDLARQLGFTDADIKKWKEDAKKVKKAKAKPKS